MMYYPRIVPQESQLSCAYLSPRFKPPSLSQFKRKLPNSRRPLSDITNLPLTQDALELPPSTPRLGGPEESLDRKRAVLRSPIPLTLSLRTSPRFSFSFRSPSSKSVPGPLSRLATSYKQTRCRTLVALRSPPPSPTRRSSKCTTCSSSSIPKPPSRAVALPSPPVSPPVFHASCRELRPKREIAELQWQTTIHRSLAWKLRTQYASSENVGGWNGREDGAFRGMNLGTGGLMIVLDGVEKRAECHWTDMLDRTLVTRLGEKLLAQECKPVSSPDSNFKPITLPISNPTPARTPERLPFPRLAPDIQLESAVDNKTTSIPRRARVTAIMFSSAPSGRVPALRPFRNTRITPTCELPLLSGTPPKGILTPQQLVAQTMLRRSQARAKPMKRSSMLRRGTVLVQADEDR